MNNMSLGEAGKALEVIEDEQTTSSTDNYLFLTKVASNEEEENTEEKTIYKLKLFRKEQEDKEIVKYIDNTLAIDLSAEEIKLKTDTSAISTLFDLLVPIVKVSSEEEAGYKTDSHGFYIKYEKGEDS